MAVDVDGERIADPFPSDVLAVENRAEVTSNELDPLATETVTTEVFLTPELAIGDVTVDEGAGAAVFAVSLSTASNRLVTVGYATADGTATSADYTAATGGLTFAAGETSKTVSVAVSDDVMDEPDEIFTVVLSGGENGLLADAEGLATIRDDDELDAETRSPWRTVSLDSILSGVQNVA